MGVGYLTGQGGGGSNIKSIQRGTATLSATSQNVTISEVSPTKSIVRIGFKYQSDNTMVQAAQNFIGARITNSTTVQLLLNTYASAQIDVYWEVIEFNNVKSIQTGVYNTSLASDSITIANVNVSKCSVFHSCTSDNTTFQITPVMYPLNLFIANGTTITTKQFTGFDRTIYWQVIEFN